MVLVPTGPVPRVTRVTNQPFFGLAMFQMVCSPCPVSSRLYRLGVSQAQGAKGDERPRLGASPRMPSTFPNNVLKCIFRPSQVASHVANPREFWSWGASKRQKSELQFTQICTYELCRRSTTVAPPYIRIHNRCRPT